MSGVGAAAGHCDTDVQAGDSIQAAVDAAAPGDTVCVDPGTYHERVVIDKPLSLVSVDEHAATIRFEHDEHNPGFPTVDVLADDVMVAGFTVVRAVDPSTYDGGKRYAQAIKVGGFGATGGSNVVIENNVVEFAGDHDDADDVSDNGIWVMDPEQGGDIEDVDVIDNDVSGFADTGIAALGVYGDSVVDVTVRGNTIADIDRGDPEPVYVSLLNATGTVGGNAVDNVGGDHGLQTLGVRIGGDSDADVRKNSVKGHHRVGVLVEGSAAQAAIADNEITGVGPTTTGWAENGIQVSSGASATVKKNTVSGHWWGTNDFVSSGIIVFNTDDVTVNHNDVVDNDLGIALFGDGNNAIHNDVVVTTDVPDIDDILHYGVMVSGDDNGVRQSTVAGPDGEASEAGIYVFGGSDRTKLIRNAVSGWAEPIVDQGDDTKLPRPFDPSAG